jgi:regulation of enolase protein 1 (concanavalin A-like superfamily)
MADKGALRIAGNTDGVTGKNDTVVFHHRELEGDWTLVAHVAAISGGVAGIMVREKVALSCWCLAATIADDGSIIVRTREHAETPAILTTPLPSPKQGWLEMVRRGPSLIVAHSADGKTWRVLSTLAPPGMSAKVPVGFFASGATATGSATATFDHLSLKLGK